MKKWLLLLVLIASINVVSAAVDLNITNPSADGNYVRSSLDITFSVIEPVTGKDLNADINYSSDDVLPPNIVIGVDLNLDNHANVANLTCDGVDFNSIVTCTYTWDISGVGDGNYHVDVNVYSVAGTYSDTNRTTSSFMIDNTAPDVNSPTPTSFTQVSTSTPTFSVNISDGNSGIDYCNYSLYYDGSGAATSSATATCGATSCSQGVTLTWIQRANMGLLCYDRAGNTSDLNTGEYEYSLAGGGTPANIQEGSGTNGGLPSAVPSPLVPAQPVPFELLQVLQPAPAPSRGIPFVSDMFRGAEIAWNWLMSLFRFR